MNTQRLDCEIAVLGGILLSNEAFYEARAKLKPEDFALDSHRIIFTRMCDLVAANKPIDFQLLSEELDRHREMSTVGGIEYVISLTDGLPRVKNIGDHADVVFNKSQLRQTIHACNSAMHKAEQQGETAKDVLDALEEHLLRIRANQRIEAARSIDFVRDRVKALFAMRSLRSRTLGFSYGINGMNDRTTGIRRQEYVVVGGRPKDGKTALALEIIQANCTAGIPILFFSLEMNRDSVTDRLLCSTGQIEADHIRVPARLDEEETVKLNWATEQLERWPFYIDNSRGLSISELVARAKLMITRHNVGVVVVDYVQLVDAPGRDIRDRVSRVSNGLRMLAGDHNIAVIALSQLARKHDSNERPQIHELKESGSLEADANTIVLIYRPTEKGAHTHRDELLITQRSGEDGICPVTYLGKYVRFEDRAWSKGES